MLKGFSWPTINLLGYLFNRVGDASETEHVCPTSAHHKRASGGQVVDETSYYYAFF